MESTKSQSENLCLVTAFLDIGRDGWHTYSRTVSEYMLSFLPYLRLNHDIIVFIDERHHKCLHDLINLDPVNANVTLISINKEWMSQQIHAYTKLELESKIMNSKSFQHLIPEYRKGCPETYSPEYNMMQHAKTDFVWYAIDHNLSTAEYFAWTDFGYFKNSTLQMENGKNRLDITKFNLEKINFQTINRVDDNDNNVLYTLAVAPEKIGGFFHMGSRILLKEYRELYHMCHEELHRMGVVDDDQHIMLRCYFKRKDLFHLWDLGGWHKIYTEFCV